MKKNRTVKCVIYPDNEQIILLNKTFGCCRKVYNLMLSDKKTYYQENKKMFYNTPARYKNDYPYLKEVDSLALVNEQVNLERAFRNFFDGRSEFPKFKSKHKDKLSYTTNSINGNIRFSDDRKKIRLPKLGWVKIKVHRNIPDHWILKSCNITKCPSGKYEIAILFEYEEDEIKRNVDVNNALGLDYSSPDFYIDSEGQKAGYHRYYRKSEEKLAREQRRLSRMQFRSSNYYKQKKKIAKIQRHIANQRKEYLHQLSTKLANKYDLICVEDINLHGLAQALKLGKSTNDNGFGIFREFLKYKMEDRGKVLWTIDKWFPSSQMCHVCGTVHPVTKDLSVREWICPDCGTHLSRDHNAAINIRNKGIEEYLASIAQ